MKESVIYQDILQKGIQKGRQLEAIEFVSRQIKHRFQEIDVLLLERIRALSIEQLENLAVASLDFRNVSDVETWLNQQ